MGEARARAKSGAAPRDQKRQSPLPWQRIVDRIFGIDLRALGVFRILLSVLVLCDLVERAPDIAAFYSDDGVLSRAALIARDTAAWGPHLSVYMLSGSAIAQAAWMILAALWAIALLVGYRTTVAKFVTWYLLMALQWRNSLMLNSADDLMRILLFWGLFLPLGARYSLDAKLGYAPKLPEGTKRYLSVGTIALLLQVGFMYWFAVGAKTDPAWRVDGMAVYYTLSIDLYATPIGLFFLNFPQILYYATFGTLWLEGLGPTLAFSPIFTSFFRTVVPIAFFFFHVIFLNLCLDLGAFHYVSAVAWIPFLPTEVWDRLERRFGRVQPKPGTTATPFSGTGEGWKRRLVPIVVNVVAGFYLVLIFLWNVRADYPLIGNRLLPRAMNRFAELPHMDQGWKMFAPKPFTENGWYVCPGVLKDGTTVDLIWTHLGQDEHPVSWEKPHMLISHMFKNERWRRYIMNLWGQDYVDQRPNYARYLCRTWNRTHTGDKQLISLELYYMLQETLDNYEQAPVRKLVLQKWDCVKDSPGDKTDTGTTKTAGKQDPSGRANSIETHAAH